MEQKDHCNLPEETSNSFRASFISSSQCPDHKDWEVIKIFDGRNCIDQKVVNMDHYLRTETTESCNGAQVLLYTKK